MKTKNTPTYHEEVVTLHWSPKATVEIQKRIDTVIQKIADNTATEADRAEAVILAKLILRRSS